METGEISVDGLKLSYHKQGRSSNTVVLLHGNSACKEVFARQFEYFKDAPFSLLAFDLPGHGASGNALNPQTNYTIPGYAKIINSALNNLHVKDFILMGWSLGGNIALEMAGSDLARDNPKFKGMMIFGAPPAGPGIERVEQAFLPATFEHAVGDANVASEQLDAFVKACYGTLNPVPEAYSQCAHRTEGKAREIMVNHWMGGANGHDQYNTVSKWQKPICVVHGQQDPFAALKYLEDIPWRHLWEDEVFILPKSGHAPFLEDPKTFNTILEKFASNVF